MRSQIYWILKCDVNAGMQAGLNAVATKFCERTAGEEGVVAYEWSLSEDGKRLHVYERYSNSDAALTHLGNVGPILDELFALVTPREIVCYGNASEAFRNAMKDFPMCYMKTFDGFHK